MNIDLIIQGPVDGSNVFLSKMDVLCKQFNKVIISTWDHEDSGAWIEKLSDYNNVVITSEKLPHRPSDPTGEPYKGIIGCSTYYWACLSTYNGLEKSSADYIIKISRLSKKNLENQAINLFVVIFFIRGLIRAHLIT